jgi:hypothetical protein
MRSCSKGVLYFCEGAVCGVRSQVDWKSANMSLERCREQWQVCQDTVRFTPPGASAVAHIEKFLQEAYPEYAQYASCTLTTEVTHIPGTVVTAVAPATAHAQAAERRRRQRCPLQLHGDNSMLVGAYALLHQQLSSMTDTGNASCCENS